MKLRGVVLKIGLGVVLAALGVVLSLVGPGQSTEQGRAAENYATHWQAQKLITVCCWDYGGASGGASGLPAANSREIAIGVSEWKVTGTVNGEAAFEETWKSPAVGAKNTRVSGDGLTSRFLPEPADSGFDASKWLLGLIHIKSVGGSGSTDDTVFAEKPIGSINFSVPSLGSSAEPYLAGNGALTCSKGGSVDQGCRVSNGAYGWLDFLGSYSTDAILQRDNSALAGGIFMPLEWQVSGTIF